MTSTSLAPAATSRSQLPAALSSAARAAADAQAAARARTDTVLACVQLPTAVYQHAPALAQTAAAVTAASRRLVDVAGQALAAPDPERLRVLQWATSELIAATADLRAQVTASATAAAWYAGSAPAGGSAVRGARG